MQRLQQSIVFLRYGLILIPGIATLYLSANVESETRYVLALLLYLAFVERRDHSWDRRFRDYPVSPLLLLEIVLLALICYRYDGLLELAFFSTLLTVSNRGQMFPIAAIAIGVVMNLLSDHSNFPLLISLNALYVTIVILLYMLGRLTGAKQEADSLYDSLKLKHYELEEARRTMLEYAKKVQEATSLEERNRIAHDLHDDLGHKLIRLKMMLEAAIRLGDTDPGQALGIVGQVRDQMSDGMESLRDTVRRMKPSPLLTSRYSLEGLIDEIAHSGEVDIRFEVTGTPYEIYPSEEFILYRNAQEAITNALRHGGASEVYVKLAYSPSSIQMTISNNGAVPDHPSLIKGLGLIGMEERLRVARGQLTVHTDPEFSIVTTLQRRDVLHG